MFKKIAKYGLGVVAATGAMVATTVPAFALFTDDANTAIQSAGADALTIGGYVVVAIAGLVVVSLAVSMIRKL